MTKHLDEEPGTVIQETPSEADIWSSYWRGPRLVCSLAGTGIGYPKQLVDIWGEFFGRFPDGSRLLDVATGNGAVAIIANDTAKLLGRRFEIHASDKADIDPGIHLRGTGFLTDGITFHARTPAEQTGFPDGHFDLVTGQFALEYTDLTLSVAEMARILKPGATARFILHMRGSEIYTQTERQLQDIHLAMQELHILQKAREMMQATRAFEQAGHPDESLLQAARQRREEYMHAARVIDQTVPTAVYKELFVAILRMVAYHWDNRNQVAPEHFIARVHEMEAEIEMAEKRHAAMCACALDENKIRDLQKRFEQSGFMPPSVDRLSITMAGTKGRVGWDLLAVRA
ncbi:MAG TPA: methyltransferase domain-containing protein [Gammaproteobacteria bacterium]|nr:methyltransferase domain-containing protein [Gammaproteobacteria bacterium]